MDLKLFDLLFCLHLLGSLAAFVAAGYGVIALIAVATNRRHGAYHWHSQPGVTILKPLCGAEAGLYDSLRCFCIQDYPCYQIVFGVSDARDPALAVARRLRDELPDRDITIVVNGRSIGTNRKVDNLANMLPAARHDYLIIADSDIRVETDYLARVVAPLTDASVGVVTCLYRARPASGLWSRLGAAFVNDWFGPSVQVAQMFGSTAFAFGATIGIRRDSLAAIGGFAAVANHLADDYMLGALTRARGFKTVLSDYVVETVVAEPSLASLMAHERRWMGTIRSVRPLSYNFSFVTCTLPLALCGVLLSWGAVFAWILMVTTVCCRIILWYIQTSALRSASWSDLWLVPIRELLTGYAWCHALLSRKIHWRNQQYALAKDGSLYKMTKDTS